MTKRDCSNEKTRSVEHKCPSQSLYQSKIKYKKIKIQPELNPSESPPSYTIMEKDIIHPCTKFSNMLNKILNNRRVFIFKFLSQAMYFAENIINVNDLNSLKNMKCL